jgi:hypothetical protein
VDGLLERVLLLFGKLIPGFCQASYDIGTFEVQVNSLRLLFQKLPEFHPEKSNFLVDSFDMRSFFKLKFFCLVQSPAVETRGLPFLLPFPFVVITIAGFPKTWSACGVPHRGFYQAIDEDMRCQIVLLLLKSRRQ